jgi:hypothetical protein
LLLDCQFNIYGQHNTFCFSLSRCTATVVYLGPNTVLIANNETGESFPIMAYSTRDNTSLNYEIRFNPDGISLVNNILTVAQGTPTGQYFVDVSQCMLIVIHP